MSNDLTLKQVLISSVIAVIGAIAGVTATALINLIVEGKINISSWWIWVIGGVIGAFLLYKIYQVSKFPFQKWRVRSGLNWCAKGGDFEGGPVEGGGWSFRMRFHAIRTLAATAATALVFIVCLSKSISR